MAIIRRQRQRVHLVHGMTPTELLEASALRWGTARMAEETAEEKAAREAEEAKAAGKTGDGKDEGGAGDGEPTEEELAALGDAGKRALERIRAERDAAKTAAETAAEKARKYDELQEANKTEQQRKDEAAAETKRVADEATLKLNRLEAALEAGLPHTAATRLVGTTKAELLADAKAYKTELDDVAAGKEPRRRRTTTDADKGGDGPSGGMSSLIRRSAGRPA